MPDISEDKAFLKKSFHSKGFEPLGIYKTALKALLMILN